MDFAFFLWVLLDMGFYNVFFNLQNSFGLDEKLFSGRVFIMFVDLSIVLIRNEKTNRMENESRGKERMA